MRDWFQEHWANPYPTAEEKSILSQRTGLSTDQISHWFINQRMRFWRRNIAREYIPGIIKIGQKVPSKEELDRKQY